MKEASFYFYDLETSGFNPKKHRVMQFAGQRTDLDLKPVGEPHNILIKMTPDVLPDPGAILVTGITPQATVADGITEAEFLKIFHSDIATPNTIFTGFNTVRFDDEFMRYMNYRNFYDPYEWHWADGRSRWDLLDLTRMTRALRPHGIKWPVNDEGVPTNRLELLTSLNSLEHANAHDALSDVMASIDWARLIMKKQPKLFEHLLELRDKKKVSQLVNSNKPFVYSSGKYSSEFEKTTIAAKVQENKNSSALVFDLRSDPQEFNKLTASEIYEMWVHRCAEYPCPHPKVPLKTLKYNRCPAVAPAGVVDKESQKRLKLPMPEILANYKKLLEVKKEMITKTSEVLAKLDAKQTSLVSDDTDVDSKLYERFISDYDKNKLDKVHSADAKTISTIKPNFKDSRLNNLLPLYKARNYPGSLASEERENWEKFCYQRLVAGEQESWAAKYFVKIEEMSKKPGLSHQDKYLLEELQLWGQSILPITY